MKIRQAVLPLSLALSLSFTMSLTLTPAAFAAIPLENKEFDATNLSELHVQNTVGTVKISSTTGPKAKVVATKSSFSKKCNLKMEREDKKLTVTVDSGVFSSEVCRVDLDIRVPSHVDLDLMAKSGKLIIHDINGALAFKTEKGDVSAVGNFREIDGKTDSGRVDVKGLSGGGEVNSDKGAVNLTYSSIPTKGEIKVKSDRGNTVVNLPRGSQIKTILKADSGLMKNDFANDPNASFEVSLYSDKANLEIKSY